MIVNSVYPILLTGCSVAKFSKVLHRKININYFRLDDVFCLKPTFSIVGKEIPIQERGSHDTTDRPKCAEARLPD
jgi:hypothetical protein